MAKKFHKSVGSRVKRLERHEEMEHGMNMKDLGSSFYDSAGRRNRTEYEDSRMIKEDYSAQANLPQEVIMKKYPSEGDASYPDLNDTMLGIDEQNRSDMRKMKKNRFPSKY